MRRALAFAVALAAAAPLVGCATASPHKSEATVARQKIARELVVRGDWGRAFVMLDELHRQYPNDADVLTLRGIVYRERGLFNDAEADLKAAVAAAPESAEAHAALGILYDVQLRPDAEAQHREAVRLAPNNPAYLNNLGFSLYLRQQFRAAIAEYEKAARLEPLSRRVRTNLGFACAAAGDWRRAAREFRMGGSEAEAKNNLGFAYERRGDMANAYDLYLEAVRLDPAIHKARSNLVHAALALGRPVPPEATPPAPAPEAATPPPAAAAPTEAPAEGPALLPDGALSKAPAAAPAVPYVIPTAPKNPQPEANTP
jgi:Flp pilus assembly protein TadD